MLALFSFGATTGIVCDSGELQTQVVPVYDITCDFSAAKKINIGGRAITDYLTELLKFHHHGIERSHSASWHYIAKTIKQECCFISQDPALDKEKSSNTTQVSKDFKLPDGQSLRINAPRFMAPEAMFQFNYIQKNEPVEGLHQMIYNVV